MFTPEIEIVFSLLVTFRNRVRDDSAAASNLPFFENYFPVTNRNLVSGGQDIDAINPSYRQELGTLLDIQQLDAKLRASN